MTTNMSELTNATGPILALDLGKYKSVACIYVSAEDTRFTTITTSRTELTRLFAKYRPSVVLIEACLLCGWVRDLCVELGIVCLVANTSSEAWKFKHLKRKTDRDDALRLVEIYRLGKFPSVAIPKKEVREKRALIEQRQKLVGRRVALQNRIRAILVSQGMVAPRGARAWSVLGLAGIAAYARPLAECATTELWRGRLELTLRELEQVGALLKQAEQKLDELAKTDESTQLLDTIPGVGLRTAEAVAAFVHEPKRFQTSKQVSAYGGLVPRQYQSTDTDHRGRITKRGPRTLRKLLVECAWCMLRYNAWARAVYQRLTHGGKTRKKQAIVALARKLLVRCWAMLRDKAPWSDPLTGPKAKLSPSKQRRQAEAQLRRARRQPAQPEPVTATPAAC
jgi:transposase